MTQILEPIASSTPARCRALPAAPVLIRIPALPGASAGRGRASARRRLRREVRVAGFWLLALIPPSVACATWGGNRPALLLSVNSPDRPAAAVPDPAEARQPAISLSLAPVLGAQSAAEAVGGPVLLSGQLLPADPAEEATHGGY